MIKIAFWGLGSIAKRHIVNLSEILSNRGETYQMDVFRHEDMPIEDESLQQIVSMVYPQEMMINQQYDIIFITNPTALHFDAIKTCASHTKHMFIEKPVFDRCDINFLDLPLKEDCQYYVACPLRYTAVLQYIKQNVDITKVYSVRAISSSYLPDWRPGEDYRNTYSAHKDLGGGVAIDLIHEWDYITSLFGFPETVHYVGGKYSDLEIDSDDLATYMGQYSDKVVELHLDYFGRHAIREITLFTQEDTIIADIKNGNIRYCKENKLIDLTENRDDYQKKELEHFLDIINGKCVNDNTIENAFEVLKITGI